MPCDAEWRSWKRAGLITRRSPVQGDDGLTLRTPNTTVAYSLDPMLPTGERRGVRVYYEDRSQP